ncbi:acyl-CoA dehydrogenase domain-containing protein [Caballeronia choica]|jgi:acyl-CoA dehydrogenase|uniref:Acyl-CoA dehydrogenase domain-containing protein n=1 Tax=Caballeronia choica TaxID=326476 RepID=A0A158JN36_9BURK|nr:acyl-CoA dehydrogenase family protein [Caballeronia choica]SAL69839.1 acyl-CoA dehydrogenase domain-containing protein [Caballeronia choica]
MSESSVVNEVQEARESHLKDVREAASTLARRFDLAYWRTCDKEEKYPWEFVNAFAKAGWMGILMPEEYGGMGLGLSEAAVMLNEIAAAGAGMSGASAVHFYVFPPQPILRHGSEAMKQRYLPLLARGELLMAFGVTEPTSGVDTSRIRTKAERRGDRWVINGQKVWTTNAQNAKKILLLARTSPRDEKRPLDGMTLFFADLDRKHCDVRVIDKLGRAAVDSNEVFIEGLEVADEDVVGEVGKGFHYLLDGLNPERIVVGMEAIGIGRAALKLAVDYANTRVVFDRPIGKNQAVAHPLAENWIRLEAAELMALRAAALYDARKSCGAEANAAKFLGADAGFRACDQAMQTHGGFAYAKEYHIERLWREVRLLRLAPISQEMVLNFVSNKVLGLPKSY